MFELFKFRVSDDKQPSDKRVSLMAEDADTNPVAEATHAIEDSTAQRESVTCFGMKTHKSFWF